MKDLYYLGVESPTECARAVVEFDNGLKLTALEVPEDAVYVTDLEGGEWLTAEPIPDYPPSWPSPDRVKRVPLAVGTVIYDATVPVGWDVGAFCFKYAAICDALVFAGGRRVLIQEGYKWLDRELVLDNVPVVRRLVSAVHELQLV